MSSTFIWNKVWSVVGLVNLIKICSKWKRVWSVIKLQTKRQSMCDVVDPNIFVCYKRGSRRENGFTAILSFFYFDCASLSFFVGSSPSEKKVNNFRFIFLIWCPKKVAKCTQKSRANKEWIKKKNSQSDDGLTSEYNIMSTFVKKKKV